MPATSVTVLKTKLSRERRTNRRLRALIDEMRGELDRSRHEIDVQAKRLGQLQAEVDVLKSRVGL